MEAFSYLVPTIPMFVIQLPQAVLHPPIAERLANRSIKQSRSPRRRSTSSFKRRPVCATLRGKRPGRVAAGFGGVMHQIGPQMPLEARGLGFAQMARRDVASFGQFQPVGHRRRVVLAHLRIGPGQVDLGGAQTLMPEQFGERGDRQVMLDQLQSQLGLGQAWPRVSIVFLRPRRLFRCAYSTTDRAVAACGVAAASRQGEPSFGVRGRRGRGLRRKAVAETGGWSKRLSSTSRPKNRTVTNRTSSVARAWVGTASLRQA
ncbi:MAG: hypothetical protein HW378_4953 [Anaerolineales bacterium]|nr:hypothetical protein [Anaerolineales bacterium]